MHKESDPSWHLCLTCLLLLHKPSQNLLFQSPLLHSASFGFLYVFPSFCLQHFLFFRLPLFPSAHWFTSKPDQLALDASLRALRGCLHAVPPLVPWSLCRQRAGVAVVWKVGPQMDIDMSGMRYVTGLGSRLSGPATAVSHNSRRCWRFFLPPTDGWEECKSVIFYNIAQRFKEIMLTCLCLVCST